MARGGVRTGRQMFIQEEDITNKTQISILELFGTIDYDPTYDYKKQRRRQ